MRRRSRRFAALAGAVVTAACSFPSVTFVDVPVDPTTGSSLDGAAEASGADATVDGPNAGDGPAAFDAPTDAAGDESTGGGGCAVACDCDNDGYRDEAAPCGGDDCDDHDPDAHPTQSYLAKIPRAGKTADYDCSGSVEKRFPTSVACSGVLVGNCAAIQGFSGDPGCGVAGEFITCKAVALTCQKDQSTTETQECK